MSSSSKNDIRRASKTLSKRSVYLPLVAFEHKVDGQYNPDAYLATCKRLPTSVQEKALVDFWHKVGVDYHRNATVKDARNNGNKPISLSDMEERIRSRAMTLIGGGINTSWDNTTTSAVSSRATKSSPNDPKLSRKQQLAHKRQRKSKHLMHFATSDESGEMSGFLSGLNGLWNEYMVKLLQLPSSTTGSNRTLVDYQKFTRDAKAWSHVTAAVTHETAQLVGARVKIKTCRHSPSWIGRIGYMVGKTKNAWNVMVEGPLSKRRRRSSKLADAGNGKEEGEVVGWRSLVVPKKGSELTLLIPIDNLQEKGAEKEAKTSLEVANTPDSNASVLTIDIREGV